MKEGHVQLYDVRVSEQLQVLNLSFHPASHVSVYKLPPRDYLQCHLLLANFMDR